jgi:hypothetical protein
MKTTNLEYTNIPTRLPSIDFFLEKIKNDELFYFLRVNHGFIDSFHFSYQDYTLLQKDLVDENYEIICKKILKGFSDKKWGISHWHGSSEKYVDYTSILLSMLVNPKKISQKLDVGISLGVGLNTHWGVWSQEHPVQLSRTKFAKILVDISDYNYFYSGVLKHYTIKKEIFKLFELLNTKKYNVIFLGPDYFERHKNIFLINNFSFVKIPKRKAMDFVEEYIQTILDIKNNNNNPTIVFTQCGSSVASKIIYDLINHDISVIDVGRSFDILIKEEFTNGNLAEKCWTFLDENHLNNYVDNLRK